MANRSAMLRENKNHRMIKQAILMIFNQARLCEQNIATPLALPDVTLVRGWIVGTEIELQMVVEGCFLLGRRYNRRLCCAAEDT